MYLFTSPDQIGNGFCPENPVDRKTIYSRQQDSKGHHNKSLPKISIDPIEFSEGYSAVLYDNTNGLPTSEANAIAMTGEGFIWIGTNDNGVAMMKQGDLHMWRPEEGMKSTSVRAIAEDGEGIVYVATTAGILYFDKELELCFLDDPRIADAYMHDLRVGNDGLVYGLTQTGDILAIKEGKLVHYLDHEESRVKGVMCILPDPKIPERIYLGTENSEIYFGNLERNFAAMGIKDVSPLSYLERFEYIDGKIWICAGNLYQWFNDKHVFLVIYWGSRIKQATDPERQFGRYIRTVSAGHLSDARKVNGAIPFTST